MGIEDSNNAAPNGQASNGAVPPSQALNSDGQAPNETPNKPPLSREDLEAIAASARKQAAEARVELNKLKAEKQQQEEAGRRAEEERLRQQGEYQKLLEQQAPEFERLRSVEQDYLALSASTHKQIDAEIKDWPKEVKALVPSAETPVHQRMDRLNEARAVLALVQQQARSQSPGNGPNPKPAGNTPEDLSKQYEQRMRRSGGYFKV